MKNVKILKFLKILKFEGDWCKYKEMLVSVDNYMQNIGGKIKNSSKVEQDQNIF